MFRHPAIIEHLYIQNPAKFAPRAHGDDARDACLPGNDHGNTVPIHLV